VSTLDSTRIDREALLQEVERYLAAVDAFRAEGAAPSWRPEPRGWTRVRRRRDAHTVKRTEVIK